MRKDSQESAYRYLEYTYEVSHQIMQKSKNKCLSGGRGKGRKGPYPIPFYLVVLKGWNMLVWNIYQENIMSEDFCKEIYI